MEVGKDIKFLILDVDGTMTDGGVYVMEDGKQFKKFNAKDGMGIKMAMKAGIEVGIISHSHITKMVESRAEMLGLKYVYVGTESKLEILRQWIYKFNVTKRQVAYIGDDVNDLEIMNEVGLAACPSDAVDSIKKISDVILSKKGGEGCVREFIDQYLLK
jgi:3-deoxy-D-manno-octulosonate 8-phosphate phosphatase (KDO 8-P phosphatase)